MSFISYYFHWSNEEVMALEHNVRRKWCTEISTINTEVSPSESKPKSEKSILDINFRP